MKMVEIERVMEDAEYFANTEYARTYVYVKKNEMGQIVDAFWSSYSENRLANKNGYYIMKSIGGKNMKTTDAQMRASMKYEKANIKRVVLKLNKNTDQDIIEFLDGLKSVNGEIKRLIREEIKKK